MKKINKPPLTLAQIINMSIGFLGIQFGFALQNGNASRILQTLGADVEHLSYFWLAAPLTGMLIQPLIGHYSDRTWGRYGRRKPYFLVGALLASTALFFMPNASALAGFLPAVYIGAGILMFMDASFNVAMEPFRALVNDNLSDEQNTLGFSVQTFLIGIGAVVGSALPKWLADAGVASTALDGQIPANVIYSFYAGAVVFIGAILWTVLTTKEYSPKEREKMGFEPETENHHLRDIVNDFLQMPSMMKQLGLVQFCSWFALFSMWVYSTPAIAHHVYGTAIEDHSSSTYNEAANMVGYIFSIYNVVSAVYALCLPFIARRIGKKATHSISLTAGGLGLVSIYLFPSPEYLPYCMVGVGMAWASILAMPYALLANCIPTSKMGVYMGIFNFFITLPQIVNGLLGGIILKNVFTSNSIYSLVMAGMFMFLGAIVVLFVREEKVVG